MGRVRTADGMLTHTLYGKGVKEIGGSFVQ